MTLSEGDYISTLFTICVRELNIDTERPVDISRFNLDEFDMEDAEDEDRKVQGNTAFVFSQALHYATSLIR